MIQTITVWAIRHKPTGYFLPEVHRGGGRPIDAEPEPPTKVAPRVFGRLRPAQIALSYWLNGNASCQYGDEGERLDRPYRAGNLRRREDMEVVPLELII